MSTVVIRGAQIDGTIFVMRRTLETARQTLRRRRTVDAAPYAAINSDRRRAAAEFTAHFTPCLEIGWRLAPAAWGHGYAMESAAASSTS